MLRVSWILPAGTPAPTASSSATWVHRSATLTAGDKGWVQRLAGRAKRSSLRRPFLLVHASMWPRLLPHVWGVSLKDFLLS